MIARHSRGRNDRSARATRRAWLAALAVASVGSASLTGGSLAAFGDGETDGGSLTTDTWSRYPRRVTYTSGGSLGSAVDSGTASYGVGGVDVIGPVARGFAGSDYHVPVVDGSDALLLVAKDGSQTSLDLGSTTPRGKASALAVAAWNGDPLSVYYPGGGASTLYRVAPGGTPATVAQPSNGIKAALGPGDVDGDGDRELLFADGSQQLRYVEPNGSLEKVVNGGTGSNDGIGAGSVADLDDDGVVAVVTIDGSNDLKVVGEPTAQGGEGKTTISSVDAAKAPVTVADVDGDDANEVVYVSTGGHLKYVDDVYGSPTISFVRDADGDTVDADDATGVV